ncbi:MAG TPA: hypothetical protein DEA08_08220 [Planctomycetes bacterium]|nr:hypothetical protein [Planctomycetota bacterium]
MRPLLEEQVTFAAQGLELYGLSLGASRRGRQSPPPRQAPYRIWLGHAPDVALTGPDADLILAGHTHGGQVQLPFFGPLLTLSRVPRGWAAGRTELPGGGTLIVSRGIGMERDDAPRLRFLCRPELVVLDLVPVPKAADAGPSGG